MKNVALLLCGAGYLDGSEIREAVGALWALSKHGYDVQCFAPDAAQKEVVNTLTGEPDVGTRNMLVESARVARGKVAPLSSLRAADFSALVVPGGFGAAKSLCTFAYEGSKASILPEVETTLKNFHAAGKPMALLCISPVLAALTFKGKGLELTVGEAGEVPQEIEKLGHRHVVKAADDCHVDSGHKIVSSPAYMYDTAPLHSIFTGIEKAIQALSRL